METRFSCDCGKSLNVTRLAPGQRVMCPGCGSELTVPDNAAGRELIDASGDPCPACGAALSHGAVICVQCGTDLKSGHKLQTQVQVADEPKAAKEASVRAHLYREGGTYQDLKREREFEQSHPCLNRCMRLCPKTSVYLTIMALVLFLIPTYRLGLWAECVAEIVVVLTLLVVPFVAFFGSYAAWYALQRKVKRWGASWAFAGCGTGLAIWLIFAVLAFNGHLPFEHNARLAIRRQMELTKNLPEQVTLTNFNVDIDYSTFWGARKCSYSATVVGPDGEEIGPLEGWVALDELDTIIKAHRVFEKARNEAEWKMKEWKMKSRMKRRRNSRR